MGSMGITMVEIKSHIFFNLEEGSLIITLLNEGSRGFSVLTERTDRNGDTIEAKKVFFAEIEAAQAAYNEATK